MKQITVNTPNEAYKKMQVKWHLIDALMGGTLAMRQQAQKYLPEYPRESRDRYITRLNNSVLLEEYKKTIQDLAGKPFGSAVTLEESAEEFYKVIADNVDQTGRNLTVFSRECFTDLLLYGKTHIMAEYPNTTELQNALGRELTLADEQQLNLRPYLVRVSPHNIINWDAMRIGGAEVLTRLHVRHLIPTQKNNPYLKENKEVVVVWSLQEIQVWENIGDDDDEEIWVLPEGNIFPNTLGKIPLITVYANKKGLLESEPPLEGMAHLNAKHWRNQSDQDNIEQVARVPMLFFRGFSKEDLTSIEVGPFKIFGNKDPQSDVTVVETNGSAVKVGSDALRELENQMRNMGMAPLQRKTGNPTATELAIEAGREVSDIEAYVMLMEQGLYEAFKLCAEWDKRNPDTVPKINISEDLGYTIVNGSELTEIREDYKLGVLDRRTYLAERKRRGLYHETVEVDEIIAGIETEDPFLGDED